MIVTAAVARYPPKMSSMVVSRNSKRVAIVAWERVCARWDVPTAVERVMITDAVVAMRVDAVVAIRVGAALAVESPRVSVAAVNHRVA